MDEKIAQFIKRNHISFSAKFTDTNPNIASDEWMRGTTHWKVTFRCQGRQLTTYFSQGPAISREPSAEDVLDCLASDAAGIANSQDDFEEWAREYGFDTDSRKAETIFEACRRNSRKLYEFLPVGEFENLLYHTEKL